MNLEEKRAIAISAARSYARKMGINPEEKTGRDMLIILMDRTLDPNVQDTIAVQWAKQSSERQQMLFIRDSNKWIKKQKSFYTRGT